jgi:hypothetical protein
VSDFNLIRHELNKLKIMPPWGQKQGDRWDRLSNFVYELETLQEIWSQVNIVARTEKLEVKAFGAYAINRWYNHHTHDQILQMFYAHPDVQREENPKHRTVDFYLRGLPFDLKISHFPRTYPENIEYAQQHPHHLAHWLYAHQSKQGRYHTGNRLFIILHDRSQPELSWQLRRDFAALERLVQNFLAAPILLGLTLTNPKTHETPQPWSAVLFHLTKSSG